MQTHTFGREAALIALPLLAGLIAGGAAQAQVTINEIYASHNGNDTQEYVELVGPPGLQLDGYLLLVVEGDGIAAGTLDRVYNLTGRVIPPSGFFVCGDNAVTNVNYQFGVANALEDGTQTYYLVNNEVTPGRIGFVLLGTDVSTGVSTTVIPSEANVLDLIAQADGGYPATDRIFDGAQVMGPDGFDSPAGFFRGSEAPNPWCNHYLDPDNFFNSNLPRTPGGANIICCQTDLGSQGPGTATLSICGGPFVPSNLQGVDLVIANGPPGSVGGLMFSLSTAPLPFAGGTIVPNIATAPPPALLGFDANGEVRIEDIPNGGFAFTAYVQVFYFDATIAPFQIGITNAVEWEFTF